MVEMFVYCIRPKLKLSLFYISCTNIITLFIRTFTTNKNYSDCMIRYFLYAI